jgi:hypothetical protein
MLGPRDPRLRRGSLALIALLLTTIGMVAIPNAVPRAYADDPSFAITRNFGPASGWTKSVAVGDVDADGDLDLVVGSENQPDVVYLNDGTGNFPTGRAFNTEVDETNSVAVGDMDADGDLDIVANGVMYLNDGAGNFPTSRNFGGGQSEAVGDMDADGDLVPERRGGQLPHQPQFRRRAERGGRRYGRRRRSRHCGRQTARMPLP